MKKSTLVLLLCLAGPALAASLLQHAASLAKPAANPLRSDVATQQKAGEKLFARECAGCHGPDGRGNGRRHTPILDTDLVRHADAGTLFWILQNGSSSHRMPSFSHLPEPQRWQIISYLQRRNSGSNK